MKRLALFTGLLLITLISRAQFSIDGEAFRASRVDVYYGVDTEEGFFTNRHDVFNTDALFFFKDGLLVSQGLKNQLKCFYVKDDPKYTPELIRSYGGYGLECLDHGFFKCYVNIIYVEKSDVYAVRIDYSNMRFFFECKITSDRPWDNDPIDLVADAQSWPNDPDYTDEEVIAFFKKHFSGNEFAKAIAQGLILDALTEF